MQKIVVIEPTWSANIHFPFNAGLLRTVGDAFPGASLTFIGDKRQSDAMLTVLSPNILSRCRFANWKTQPEVVTSPIKVMYRTLKLLKIAARDIYSADLIIFASAAGTCLTALRFLPRQKSSNLQIFLHGNLNDLHGWRTKNPINRYSDLYSNLSYAARKKAQLVLLEEHIRMRAIKKHPWMAANAEYFPHPSIPSENISIERQLDYPIKIGMVGISSPAKGFCQFRDMASKLKSLYPGRFEFHTIGKRHPSNRDSDFLELDTQPSDAQIERNEFLNKVDNLHFLFFWPDGEYYENASSGVFYDALNRKIPVITKNTLENLQFVSSKIGILAESMHSVEEALTQLNSEKYCDYVNGIAEYSKTFQHEALVERFRLLTQKFDT